MKYLFIPNCIICDLLQGKPKKSDEVKKVERSAIVTEEFIYEIKDAFTPECHASTVEVSNGIVVASWFGGTKEKNDDVGIWVSRKITVHGLPPPK